MFNILTLNKIAACGLDKLGSNYAITDDMSVDADGIILRSYKMHDMELPASLKAVARAGAGTNNIPIDKCTEKGVVVFNTPGANANAVKELVIAGLMLASRDIIGGNAWANSLTGDDISKQVEKGKSNFAGNEIYGKTLGIIGLGAIGILVANAAHALGMDVIGYDPFLSVNAAIQLEPAVKVTADINDIYKNSDYITIHVPYTPDTKNTIDEAQIAMMKDGVRLINLARGELINSAAVVKAIKDGKVAKYVTDFADDVVLGEENVIVLPHLGASTPESEDNCATMAAHELIDYIEKGTIKNSVNFPNAELAKTGDHLVCVLHKNVPALIAQITSVVSDKGANIENLVNKSKKDWAYTMLDVTGDVDADAFKSIEGVVGVRVL